MYHTKLLISLLNSPEHHRLELKLQFITRSTSWTSRRVVTPTSTYINNSAILLPLTFSDERINVFFWGALCPSAGSLQYDWHRSSEFPLGCDLIPGHAVGSKSEGYPNRNIHIDRSAGRVHITVCIEPLIKFRKFLLTDRSNHYYRCKGLRGSPARQRLLVLVLVLYCTTAAINTGDLVERSAISTASQPESNHAGTLLPKMVLVNAMATWICRVNVSQVYLSLDIIALTILDN